jgi:hypothetical protein
LRLAEMPPLRTSVENMERGARLRVGAKVPAQRNELVRRLHERLEEISQGPCDWP